MFAIAFKDDRRWIEARLRTSVAKLEGPARKFLVRGLRIVYPLVLLGMTIFVASFGAFWSAAVAFVAATILITRSFSPLRRGRRRTEMAAAVGFCAAVAFGLPTAVYNFSTEPCIGLATSLTHGDVRSLSDPRLDEHDRSWVQRATTRLAPSWPQQGVPALDSTALANVVVQARALVQEIAWRGSEPLTRLGLMEAKQAYAATHFDRRQVCYLFGAGGHGRYLTDGKLRNISEETDRALALILPALQATYKAPPAAPMIATPAEEGIKLASRDTSHFN